MSHELIHTSVEKGLRGVSGFATAVATRGLPPALEPALEELSAYDFDASRVLGADRVDWAHRIVTLGGRSHGVLSRTVPSGSDWSGRPNRVAHHVVIDVTERAAAGPAWMLSSFTGWVDGVSRVEERASGPAIPRGGAVEPRPAAAWAAAGFDSGWAGVVARALLDAQGAPCYLVLPPDCDALPLLCDVFVLLPEDRRWHVTFSTRFQRVAANTRCQLRCVRRGAPSLRTLLAEPGIRQIHAEPAVSAGESEAAEAGRRGAIVEIAQRPSTRVDPALRMPGDSRVPRAAAVVAATEQNAPATLGDDGASPAPRSFEGPGRADARPWQPQPPSGNLVASILFGIAAVALLATFVLVVLIVLRR